MDKIKIGDQVVCWQDHVCGVVIDQYHPTASEQQTMIITHDGKQYHAPTRCFEKGFLYGIPAFQPQK